jgi:hypothetical protein
VERLAKGSFGSRKAQRTILSYIPSILVNMLELPERLDDINILARPRHNVLGAFVKAVVEHLKRLEHMAPVLAFVVQPLVYYVHDLVEGGRARLPSAPALLLFLYLGVAYS